MKGAVGASLRRSVLATALCCLVHAGCESDVVVQLLPGDNQQPSDTGGAASGVGGTEAGTSRGGLGNDGGAAGCLEPGECPELAPALSFRGPYDTVEIKSSRSLDVPQDFAMEAWVFVASYSGGHSVLNRWVRGLGDIQLTFGVPEPMPVQEFPFVGDVPSWALASWVFVGTPARPWLSIVAPSLPTVGEWHHLASSYGGGTFRLYVDGVLTGSVAGTEPVANAQSNLYIGATNRTDRPLDAKADNIWWPPIAGYIAEVRLSSINRYAQDFEPERRLQPDGSTIALWHLDEGEGDLAVDSGPNQLNGRIGGAEWVLAPARPEP